MTEERTPPPGAGFEEVLQQLRAEFARQLPGRLAEAATLLAACRADPADDAALAGLYRVLHRIAGSAGTFGLHEVGDRARALEEALEALQEKPQRVAGDFDPVDVQLQQLATAAAAL